MKNKQRTWIIAVVVLGLGLLTGLGFLGYYIYAGMETKIVTKPQLTKAEAEKKVTTTESNLAENTTQENDEDEDDANYESVIQVGNITIKPGQKNVVTQAAAQEQTGDGEYILPNSSTQELIVADVENLSAEELRLARNEILARHGRIFKNADLKAYFEGKSWYQGTTDGATFDSNMDNIINATEKKNIELIKKYE